MANKKRMAAPLPVPASALPMARSAGRGDLPLGWLVPHLAGLPAGLPRGALSLATGPRSAGLTGLRDAVLAAATAQGEYAALVDAPDQFDPQTAAQAGIALERLLWVRCGGEVEHALKAADLLIHGGGFGVVCLDLGEASPRDLNRIPLSYWFRLRAAVQGTPAVVLILSRRLPAISCAACSLELRRQEAVWSGEQPARLLRGLRIEAWVRKPGPERAARWVAEAF